MMKYGQGWLLVWVCGLFSLTGCSLTPPPGVVPVENFEVERYEGRWYEIARLDHRFERGLSRVTAEYTLKEDGSVHVLNRGYNERKVRWEEAEGRARFAGDRDVGFLEVSFFGPFYGAYVIFDLDEDYQHAMVSGPNHSYLWLLSRSSFVDEEIIDSFKAKARSLGFNTEELILVDQRAP